MQKIITDVEYIINESQAAPEKKNEVRHRVAAHLQRICRAPRQKMVHSTNQTLISDLQATKRFLKENDQLLVLKADKGNATVLMKKNEYKNKILQLLEDETTYKKRDKDPTSTIEAKSNKYVKTMFEKKYINERLKNTSPITPAPHPSSMGYPRCTNPRYP